MSGENNSTEPVKMDDRKCFPDKVEFQLKAVDKSYCSNNVKPKLNEMSKIRIIKNLLIVCLGYLFLFSAYQALANLQSTLNIEGNLGIVSQSVIYAALIFSALFLPKLIIRKLGCKLTLTLCVLTYSPYVAANFYPHMATFVPSAIFIGLGAGPLWSAKCTYLNEISALYASQTSETSEVVTSRFFGIFFMFFQNTQIWGNLVSFFVLRPSGETDLALYNSTSIIDIEEISKKDIFTSPASEWNVTSVICGASFCSGINDNLKPPSEGKRYVLIGIYLSLTFLAALIMGMFLDPLPKKKDGDDESALTRISATLKHLKKMDQLLLVPITIFSGIEQAFILGDYTKAYVACAWGLHNVGLVFICFGVVNAVMSFFTGRLVKYVSRMALMLWGAFGNIGVCVVLFLWQPDSEKPAIFFILVGIWGMSDAVWQTQINALYGVMFRSEEEAAFSNYRLWESVGFSIAFGYSAFLCIIPKISILLAFLICGITGYIIVEMQNHRRTKSCSISIHPDS